MIDASHYTPQYQLDQMRELSPAVDTYLAQELFKEDFGAYDYTISEIVNNCYEIIIDELIDLGIKFSVTRSELLQDYFTAYNLITLKKVIDKRYLKVWLNGISQEKLELLDTSINNNEDEFSILVDTVDLLYSFTGDSDLELLKDFAVSYTVSTHLLALNLDLNIKDASNSTLNENNLNSINSLLDLIDRSKIELRNAIDEVISISYEIRQARAVDIVDAMLKEYGNYMINPENLPKYANIADLLTKEPVTCFNPNLYQNNKEVSSLLQLNKLNEVWHLNATLSATLISAVEYILENKNISYDDLSVFLGDNKYKELIIDEIKHTNALNARVLKGDLNAEDN